MTFVENLSGRPNLQRGAAGLPSAFTLANLFFGFAAIVKAFHGDYAFAAQLIVVAGVFDVLDGRIARLTGCTSELGAELDSLADLVSFGVAPAVIAYQWGLVPHHQSFLAAFVLVLCAAVRLARFNVLRQTCDGRSFTGLPSPAAAGMVVSIVLLHPTPPTAAVTPALVAGVLVLAGALMVSPIPYQSFKKTKVTLHRYQVVLVVLAALAAIVFQPAVTLVCVAWGYAASGPVRAVLGRRATVEDGLPR